MRVADGDNGVGLEPGGPGQRVEAFDCLGNRAPPGKIKCGPLDRGAGHPPHPCDLGVQQRVAAYRDTRGRLVVGEIEFDNGVRFHPLGTVQR